MADNKKNEKKFHGLYVEVRNEPGMDDGQKMIALEHALKKFKRMIKHSNLMLEIQKTQHFIKPSEQRKERKNRSIARAKGDARRRERENY